MDYSFEANLFKETFDAIQILFQMLSNSIHWFTYLGSQLLLKSSLINSVIPQFSNFFSQTENTDILEPLLSGAAFLLIIIQVYLIESLQWRSISAGNIVSRPFCPHWLNSTQNPHIFWSVKDSVTKVNFFNVKKEKEMVCDTLMCKTLTAKQILAHL